MIRKLGYIELPEHAGIGQVLLCCYPRLSRRRQPGRTVGVKGGTFYGKRCIAAPKGDEQPGKNCWMYGAANAPYL